MKGWMKRERGGRRKGNGETKGKAKRIWRELRNGVSGGKEGEGQESKQRRRRDGERARGVVIEILIVIIWIVRIAA